jgi:nucleotide sugar dehydrogenase
MSPSPDVCVVGLGYVGLPLAVALAEAGSTVVGYDASPARVASLAAGRSGIEDIPDATLASALASGMSVTADIADAAAAKVYVICVPTPLREHEPDLAYVEGASSAIATVLSPGDLVILESTTYPGTTDEVVAPLLMSGSGLAVDEEFLLAYSPERIDPTNDRWTLRNTPKVVGGCSPAATEAACDFYRKICDEVVPVRGTREAEMAKLLENTFRHVNIALVNEMAVFCQQLGIDLWEVIRAAATKPFGFMPFYPGPGVGGHCIPVDPSYLSWRLRTRGHSFRFVELAQEVNRAMPAYVVSRLGDLLNQQGVALSRATVLCLGASYKPGVSDVRESPAIEVMERLRAKGATVVYADPRVPSVTVAGETLTSATPTPEVLASADVAVLLTAHPEFDVAAIAREVPALLDTRGTDTEADNVHRL